MPRKWVPSRPGGQPLTGHRSFLTTAVTVAGIILLVVSATLLGSHYLGHGRAGPALSSAALPSSLSPQVTAPPATTAPATGAPATGASATKSRARQVPATRVPQASGVPNPGTTVVPDRPGVPVAVLVAGHRVNAAVSADRLEADGSLYVPPDPRAVSWASQQVGPGSSYGTTILVGHINYGGTQGAFADLADYRVGQVITLVLADGRRLRYAVAAAPIEVHKDTLGPRRQELFDQTHSYGPAGKSRSGRLLLLSCGGRFDNRTGHYESNIFVYALPV